MKYFLVVGEASGDVHASHLMRALQQQDLNATFTYMGGSLMRAVGGECLVRSEEMAFMGFADVLKNLSTIQRAGKILQQALLETQPDVVICVDYASFSFHYILPFVRRHLSHTKLVYYIPPKVWAWKKHRLKKLRSHTDLVLTIFPFEVDYFAKNRLSQAHYVGNPTYESVENYLQTSKDLTPSSTPPTIALLCGSRQSEIRQNLPTMLEVGTHFPEYHMQIAMAPGVPKELYQGVLLQKGATAELVEGDTFGVAKRATAAMVTSGTATLETALLGTPQVVGYATKGGAIPNWAFRHFFTVPYISLVNLIAQKEVVPELFAARFTVEQMTQALGAILTDTPQRRAQLEGYAYVRQRLQTTTSAASSTASEIQKLFL